MREICFNVSDRGKIFEIFFKSRIHSVFIDVVDRYNGGVMNELVLLNCLVFDSVWIRNINESVWNEVDS